MRFAAAFFLAIGVVAAQAAHGGLMIPFLPLPAYALVALGLICALPTAFGAGRQPWPWPVFAVIALAAYALWRCVNAPDATLALADGLLILACVAMWSGVSVAVTRNDARFVFLVICLAAASAQVVFAVLQLVREAEFAMPYWFSGQLKYLYESRFAYRPRGLFMNPNQFAWLMNAMALVALSVGLWGRLRIVTRIALLYLGAVFGVMTVLSASRGGMLSLMAGFGTFLILSLVAIFMAKGARRILLLGVGLVLLTLCASATYAAFSTSWLAQSRLDSLLKADVRSGFVEQAIRQFQTDPLFGVGSGMYRYAARMYRTGDVPSDPIYAHDDWLQFLAEYGFVGLSILVIVIVTALYAGGRSFLALVRVASIETGSATSTSAAFTLGAVCALVAAAVHANVDFNMHIPANALLAAALLGFVTGVRPTEFERQPSRFRPFLWVTALAGLAACTGLGVILSQRAMGDYYALRADNALTAVNIGQARDDADRGVRLLPHDAGLLDLRGRALFDYESWLQATTTGEIVPDVDDEPVDDAGDEEINEDDEPANENAVVLLTPEESRKNFEDAAQSFAEAARLQPMERELYIGWGKADLALQQPQAARGKFATAIRLDPMHAHTWAAYGDYLLDGDRALEARRYYEIGAHLPYGEYSVSQVEAIDLDIANEKELELEEQSE